MKKLKILGAISFALIGGGALVSIPFAITSCGKKSGGGDDVPARLIIDGAENGTININTTLNLAGTYTFYCHDDIGGMQDGVSWSIDNDYEQVSIDQSTGVLSWPNNLDPQTSYNFELTCHKRGLTDATCTIDLTVNQTPGNDVCPYSWFNVAYNGQLTLKSGVDRNQIRNLVIPDEVANKLVTAIGIGAFGGCSKITNLTLPNSLTSIDEAAFGGCSNITNLTLPNSLVTIGNNAFDGCSSLTGSLIIPDSVTSIGNSAFNGCSRIGSLTIGNSVISIGRNAFNGCSKLIGSLTIPNSVTLIGVNAFGGCSGLNGTLTIGSGVTSIGNSAFNGCSGLIDSWGTNGADGKISENTNHVYYIRNNTTYYCLGSYLNVTTTGTLPTGALTILDGTKIICTGAFANCGELTGALTIGNNVTSIGGGAFDNCTELNGTLTIGVSVTSIGNMAFRNCNKFGQLTFKNFTEKPNWTGTGIFEDWNNTTPGTVSVTDGSWAVNGENGALDYAISKGLPNTWTAGS